MLYSYTVTCYTVCYSAILTEVADHDQDEAIPPELHIGQTYTNLNHRGERET